MRVSADKQGYQQSYDAALVGADRSKDIVVLRLLNLQVRCVHLYSCKSSQSYIFCMIKQFCSTPMKLDLQTLDSA